MFSIFLYFCWSIIFLQIISTSQVQYLNCEFEDFSTCNFMNATIEYYHDVTINNSISHNVSVVRFLFSSIYKIPVEVFPIFPNIKVLFVKSVKLTEIDLKTKTEFTQKFTSLRADFNEVTTLRSKAFLGLSNLQKINLKYNKIDCLEDEAFYGVENLKKLYLSHNKIQKLNDQHFSNLQCLESLHLDNNKLEAIPQNVFMNNCQLKILQLGSNKILTIAEGAFIINGNLKILYLNDNYCIESDIFIYPERNVSLLNDRLEGCYNHQSLFWKGKVLSTALCCGAILNFIFGIIAVIVALVKRRKKKRITFSNTEHGICIIARPY